MCDYDRTILLKDNRLPRTQSGQLIETRTAFFARFYHTTEDGQRKQKAVKLTDKSDLYRSKADAQPVLEAFMEKVNAGNGAVVLPTASSTLTEFTEKHYLPWCTETKAAPTVNGYTRCWECYVKAELGKFPLTKLQTAQVTALLTKHAKAGLNRNTLSHIKFLISGVFEYAITTGVLPLGKNPVRSAVKGQGAKWTAKPKPPQKKIEYSLETVLTMLRILEPLDLRAAVAVGLTYFAALRPAEARGLMWSDYDGSALNIQRTVWRNKVGSTKTEDSAASVPVIEPLKSLLEKLREQSAEGFVLQNSAGNPMSLDSLNVRVIAPAMKKAGIEWRGYYPGRRGISSRVTDTSKNALNSTGLLRHSTPITALKHYTRAQKDSIAAAMKTIEEQAAELMAKQAERVQ